MIGTALLPISINTLPSLPAPVEVTIPVPVEVTPPPPVAEVIAAVQPSSKPSSPFASVIFLLIIITQFNSIQICALVFKICCVHQFFSMQISSHHVLRLHQNHRTCNEGTRFHPNGDSFSSFLPSYLLTDQILV